MAAPNREARDPRPWCLDPTGNWLDFDRDDQGDGTWDLEQARTHNAANEVIGISGGWVYPVHDAAGNMTTIPQPDDPTGDFTCTYDPWNRLVKVADDDGTLVEYEYLCPCQLAGVGFFVATAL